MYGPFYVSVGLLFWAYISGLIMFAGAQFSVARMGREEQGIGSSKTAESRSPASPIAFGSSIRKPILSSPLDFHALALFFLRFVFAAQLR